MSEPTHKSGILDSAGNYLGIESNPIITDDLSSRYLDQGIQYTSNVAAIVFNTNQFITIAFKTPPTTLINMTAGVGVKFTGILWIHEEPVWTNQTGSLAAVENKNRRSGRQSELLEDQGQTGFIASGNLISAVTITNNGNILPGYGIYTGQSAASGSDNSETRYLLKTDTTYLYRFQSTANFNAAQIMLNWSEIEA